MYESESGVYWRRRGMAIAGVVAVALLLIWAFSGPGEPEGGSQATPDLNTAGSTPLNFQEPATGEPAAGDPVAGEPVAAPAQPGPAAAPVPGLPGAGLPAAGPPAAGYPAAGQPVPGQALPGQAVPGQTVPGQAVPGQPVPGQTAPGQSAPGQPQAGQFPQFPGGQPQALAPRPGTPAGIPASATQPGAQPGTPGLAPPGAPGVPGTPGTQPGTQAGYPAAGPSTGPANRALPPLNVPGDGVAKPIPGQTGARAAAPNPGTAGQPAAAPAKPCADKSISVMAQTSKQSYKVGEKPRFHLLVTNVGEAPCTRDLDAGLQEMVVTGPGQSRTWSSNDCFPAKKPDVRTLAPGKPMTFTVEWAGRTSAPGCAGQRTAVGPGDYQVVGKLGKLSSGPAVFRITK